MPWFIPVLVGWFLLCWVIPARGGEPWESDPRGPSTPRVWCMGNGLVLPRWGVDGDVPAFTCTSAEYARESQSIAEPPIYRVDEQGNVVLRWRAITSKEAMESFCEDGTIWVEVETDVTSPLAGEFWCWTKAKGA